VGYGQPEVPRHEYRFSTPRTTRTVRLLLIANIAVFLVQSICRLVWKHDPLIPVFGLVPDMVFRQGYVWQVVTYAFLHGDLLHILFNMLFLYWFGCDVEALLGTGRFLLVYMGAVVVGAAVQAVVYIAGAANIVLLGASGGVMGVLVFYAMCWPYRTIFFMLLFPMRMRTFALLTVAIDLYVAVFNPYGGVGALAHLGGAGFGFVFWRFQHRLDKALRGYALHRQSAQRRRMVQDEEALDRVLQKVHERGVHTLTRSEKGLLKRMSERMRR